MCVVPGRQRKKARTYFTDRDRRILTGRSNPPLIGTTRLQIILLLLERCPVVRGSLSTFTVLVVKVCVLSKRDHCRYIVMSVSVCVQPVCLFLSPDCQYSPWTATPRLPYSQPPVYGLWWITAAYLPGPLGRPGDHVSTFRICGCCTQCELTVGCSQFIPV